MGATNTDTKVDFNAYERVHLWKYLALPVLMTSDRTLRQLQKMEEESVKPVSKKNIISRHPSEMESWKR